MSQKVISHPPSHYPAISAYPKKKQDDYLTRIQKGKLDEQH